MSFGRGSVTGIANKHKTNAKSSTEAELIGANDAKPQMLLTSYFVEAQGFTIDESVLFRENLSAMPLVNSKRTKHIRVRYYFIKDWIAAGDIVVKHCPVREILADHFTVGKTLTGYKKGRPLPVLPRMGRPPSSAPQNQTSTSTWNSTSYT